MKARWREHEAVLISIIAAILIAGYIDHFLGLSAQQIKTDYAAPFIKANLSFSYYTRVLLPQIGCILVILFSYFWINRKIIPSLMVRAKMGTYLFAAIQILVIIYLIGPVINFISFYANPYYNNLYQFLPLGFGAHAQPFLNNFGGMNESALFTAVYLIYALFREIAIRYVEKKSYRVLIVNQTTFFMVVFFTLPFFDSIFNLINTPAYYSYYFAFTLPVALVFTTNIYWLFPLKGDKPFLRWQFIGPLLFSSFIYTLLCSVFLAEEWSLLTVLGCWAVQVLAITPVSWLDYQQRKDKILQLRGAEKELVKSKAYLQFLRSQINPHFLFNALNTLYGTALIEGSKNTAEGIQKLGDMMRFMLHENNLDFIPMEREIEYLKNYISLQKLRTMSSPDIMIEDNITEQQCNHQIAPMLLIPFVENAFKHGISLAEKSWIKIKIACDKEQINFEVHNSLHKEQSNDTESEHSGIGLKNVKERLSLLYPGKHQFVYGIEGNEFVARLTIKP
jgi:two-component system LytT family sensor kinase